MKGDVRDHPRYSISEAALYLRIPTSTLMAWTRGQDYITGGVRRTFKPLIDLADSEHKLLSFYNLAEAHIVKRKKLVAWDRSNRGVRLPNVRGWVTTHPRAPQTFFSMERTCTRARTT